MSGLIPDFLEANVKSVKLNGVGSDDKAFGGFLELEQQTDKGKIVGVVGFLVDTAFGKNIVNMIGDQPGVFHNPGLKILVSGNFDDKGAFTPSERGVAEVSRIKPDEKIEGNPEAERHLVGRIIVSAQHSQFELV